MTVSTHKVRHAGLPRHLVGFTSKGAVASLIAQHLWQQPQGVGTTNGNEQNAARQVRRVLELLGTPILWAIDVEDVLSKNDKFWWQWVILSASRILDAMCLASQCDFSCETEVRDDLVDGHSCWIITIEYENHKSERNRQRYMIVTPVE